ncbi:YxeA family protein [Clostridium sp. MB40-C1]|uniref:YxeA family protein n=1 Tax=Clostridium sp. MB40-C1 TaxID=3070996 RepID=UPI0027E0B473|nr:YxeA family protein [Clostridium sp. MB40-C1]WMJ81787.1 YxeA family protein [Clostridium sp. MB40-C1]
MKKFIGLIVALLIIVGGYYTFKTNKIITFGSTKYYVKTSTQYTTEHVSDFDIYRYKITAYDKDGNEKLLDFTANKILKVDRYLKVYVKDNVVKSYEEVQKDDLPEKVKEIYKIK